MGLVNTVVPLERLEEETVQWCREMLALSPFALRLLKASFNAAEDGLSGIQQLAHDTNLLFYGSEEAQEGRDAYREKRKPDFSRFPGAPSRLVSAARIWVMAARVRTLPAAIAPVLVGTSLALGAGHFHPLAFVAALLGAIFIQVGTNLSNDYSDARRGADTEDRLGPVRVTAGGLVPPRQVLIATYVTFGLAVACGAYLVAVAGWELLAVGAASILAGVLYTGGPRPYGYEGLGELFVFLFFGVVAVAGSYFVQVQQLPWEAFVCAVPVGPAGERDPRRQQRARPRDRPARGQAHAGRAARARAHARAVRRDARGRVRDRAAAVGARLDDAWLLLPWLALPLAVGLVRVVRTRVDGPSLNGALARTGALQLLFCLLFAAGILASGGIGS